MTSLSYPSGLPTPGSTLNSVADPEVVNAFNNILTWANGSIDNTNFVLAATILALKPNSVSGATAAIAGNLYRVTATATITLPSHSIGQVVGVMNSSGTTTVSGTNIQGVGLSSASSYTLGTPGAATVLVDDGTNWLIAAGQQDTGWLSLSLTGANSTQAGFYVPAVRVIGNLAVLRGYINIGTANATIATVPAVAKPTSSTQINASFWNSTTYAAISFGVSSVGNLAMGTVPAVGAAVTVDGFTYSLS